MAKLNLKAVEARVEPLGGRDSYDREIIFELLDAYGKPQSSITRLRKGSINVAAEPEVEVAQKGVVYFREVQPGQADLLVELEELRSSAHVVRFTPRFVIVTDYRELLAHDSKTGENLITEIADINKHFTFFLPWAGMEKAQYIAEAHADVKAAEKMSKLFDELLSANPDLLESHNGRHSLNVFFTRLLFCFFAEDTGIFADSQFTNAVGSHTLADGSDTQEFLVDLFDTLDLASREQIKPYLAEFPYVNGRLFERNELLTVPRFTKKARESLIELGTLMWQEINPDIFGSMFQAIVKVEHRANLGQHYTSVPNILKTIEPLFMDELREEFDKNYDNTKKLEALLQRIGKIKIFDPACGSGNFLVIAYKELRRLEHAILERLAQLDSRHSTLFTDSKISIESFYGIEIEDFAAEVAVLSMWIAKHQLNREFKDKFGVEIPLIPLKESGNIVVGNAARLDWKLVCPADGDEEIFLIGNPPYKGGKATSKEQKADYPFVFGKRGYSKDLDYISLWFVKGAEYVANNNAQLSFVSTNSITQGEQPGLLFPFIYEYGLEIGYAYTSFKWENNAKRNAGVTVVVINLRSKSSKQKYLFTDDLRQEVEHINAYLVDAKDIFVTRRTKAITPQLPRMVLGSMPKDGGHLCLDSGEAKSLVSTDSRVSEFVKKYVGSSEYINGTDRFCIWVEDKDLQEAISVPAIAERLQRVAEWRLNSKAASTAEYAEFPNRFKQIAYKETDSIIVPRVSSQRRTYVPIGYLGSDTVISDSANAVYDAEPWLFAVLTSKMHMAWLAAVGGKLKTDYRYGAYIVYNTFPVPELSEGDKEALTVAALRVLDVREYHAGATLAELYDPDKMPWNLVEAHKAVDDLVDRLYGKKVFETDEDRLSLLFEMYEQQIEAEKLELTAKKPARRRSK